ncbi:purine-binding chemotaxis protein CheW [Novosphingobium sp. SG751A]|uniref:chemotaxis protein CheW n=1 Tax=Novosphingobium sp. SG751A TaxID=2587000 RepID=UPI0015527565|nr:chemotaxis protein CheW [Novosphingobium sp. SG751A]NOW46574.1 purine-binding chemotaxis protein CheW [Novosphingobium sp. SG751A]
MTRELITFEVSRQLFGLDIAAIREIRAWSPVTRMPGTPPYIAGMANLRGTILPIIDLGARLGWGTTQTTERHAIIVVQMDVLMAGLIVETVSDLVTLAEASLQQPPSLGVEDMTSFIDGLAPVGNRMLLVLNLAQLVGREWLRGEG